MIQSNKQINYIPECLNLKQVAYESSNTNCKIGEYQFENECYPCPSNMEAQYINCYEFVKDPVGWVQNPYCQKVKYYTEEQPVFLEQTENAYLFLIVNKQLIFVQEVCQKYELIESGEARCLICKKPFLLKDDFCVRDDRILNNFDANCPRNCASCYSGQCYACVDPKKYYVSLINTQCKECTIQYCEYCFDIHKYFDDVVQGCAKCEAGYIFDFQSLLCEPNILEPNCIHGILQNGEFICLETTLPYNSYKSIQYGQCQEHINNCQSCIIDLDRFNYCVICEQGYYVQTKNGACLKCEQLMAKTCVENTYEINDYWIQELQAMYYYSTKDHTTFTRTAWSLEQIILSCKDGYTLVEQICSPVCPNQCETCISQNKQIICVDCGINTYGVIQRSTYENKCLECSSYCEYCQPQDQALIKQWNPYFYSSSYLTNKCMKVKDNSNMIILEQLYGITKQCNGITPECYLQSNIFFDLSSIEDLDRKWQSFNLNVNYLNFMAIYVYSIQYQFHGNLVSKVISTKELQFQNNLKYQVYSLTTTTIQFNMLVPFIILDISLFYLNFNVILLENLRFIIQNKNSYILCEQLEKDYTDLSIINTNIKFESQQNRGFTIIIKKLRTLNINQLIFDSINLLDEIIIDYTPFIDTEIITIFILNLTFINCQLNNTVFLRLTQLENQKSAINQCFLHNSSIISLLNYDRNTIDILSTFILQSNFVKSKVFNLPYKSKIQVDQFKISDSTLIDTELLLTNSISQVNQFIAKDLTITNATLISIQNYFGQTNILQAFTNFEISQCIYSQFQILQGQFSSFTQIDIKVEDFTISSLQAISKQTNSLINFIIIDILSKTESTTIYVTNIIYNHYQVIYQTKIQIDKSCITHPGDQGLICSRSNFRIMIDFDFRPIKKNISQYYKKNGWLTAFN